MELVGFMPIGLYAVLMGIWFVTQYKMFQLKVKPTVVMFLSGMGTSSLVITSLALGHAIPTSTEFWVVTAVLVVCGVVIAGSLVGATKAFGPSFGSNAMALAPILAIFTSWLIFGQRGVPGWLSISGILFTLLGIYVLYIDPKKNSGWLGPFRNMWGRWIGFTLAITISAGIAIPLEKRAIELSDSLMAPGLNLFLSWGIFWGIVAWWKGDLITVRRLLRGKGLLLVLLLVCTFAVANWGQSFAYHFGYAASVASLKRLYAPVTVILSWWFLRKERNPRTLLVGSSLIVIGAVLIGFDKPL